MTQNNHSDYLEIIGIVAVVASLVFVGYEIRQNTIVARASAYQAIGIATASAFDTRAHDRSFLEADRKSPEDMDETDWRQYATKMTVFARLGETVLLQVEQGLLPPDAMTRLGFSGWSRTFSSPKTACIWPLIRPGVSDSFREFVEEYKNGDEIDCTSFALPAYIF